MGPLFDSVMQSWNFLKISVLRFDPSSSPRSDRSCSGLMSWENHEVNWEFHVVLQHNLGSLHLLFLHHEFWFQLGNHLERRRSFRPRVQLWRQREAKRMLETMTEPLKLLLQHNLNCSLVTTIFTFLAPAPSEYTIFEETRSFSSSFRHGTTSRTSPTWRLVLVEEEKSWRRWSLQHSVAESTVVAKSVAFSIPRSFFCGDRTQGKTMQFPIC
ncbi:hypothetical protein SDJN02_18327 [Cucurbita argyrosperma subsp. argyrosperma]|nr:hypothetical protein SDJN02_18327 [Cucurbita argyrosperma subsp. argyrosperma]